MHSPLALPTLGLPQESGNHQIRSQVDLTVIPESIPQIEPLSHGARLEPHRHGFPRGLIQSPSQQHLSQTTSLMLGIDAEEGQMPELVDAVKGAVDDLMKASDIRHGDGLIDPKQEDVQFLEIEELTLDP